MDNVVRRSLVVLISCFFSVAASATDYYIDSVAGNDSSSGLTPAAPWKTLAKFNATSYSPGSTVFLKRGSKWGEQLFARASGLTIDSYGDSGAPPILDSSVPVTGWVKDDLLGISLGLFGGIYSSPAVSLPGSALEAGLGNLSENGVVLKFFEWKGLAILTFLGAPDGSFSYDDITKKLYIKVASDPNGPGKAYRASTLRWGVFAGSASSGTLITDITVQNINITRFSLHGVEFVDCVRCIARNLTITDGGGATLGAALYAGNGVQWGRNCSDGLAENITISNLLDSGISPQTYSANSTINGIAIRNSTIDKVGFAGVEISLLPTSAPSTISNITVSDVTITDTGRGWGGVRYEGSVLDPAGTAQGVQVGSDEAAGQVSGIRIERTTVTNSVNDGIHVFGDIGVVELDRLRLSGNRHGVHAFNNSGKGLNTKVRLTASILDNNRIDGMYYEAPSSLGLELVHNTFYRNGTRNLSVHAQNNSAILLNNVFAGDAPMAQIFNDNFVDQGGTGRFLGLPQYVAVDYNCYSRSAGMIVYAGATHNTLASFRAATGFETHGIDRAPTPITDPTGLALNTGNFSLGPLSPCIAAGTNNGGVTVDYNGNAYKPAPSMGAVEQ